MSNLSEILSSGSATETIKGVVELATQAEVDAGLDDSRVVTPLKLAQAQSGATVTSSGSNANGYYRVWSDGFKEVLSNGTQTVGGGQTKTHTFPISFSNSNSIVVVINDTNRNDATLSVSLKQNPTGSSFIASNEGGGSTKSYRWKASGY